MVILFNRKNINLITNIFNDDYIIMVCYKFIEPKDDKKLDYKWLEKYFEVSECIYSYINYTIILKKINDMEEQNGNIVDTEEAILLKCLKKIFSKLDYILLI